MTAWTEIWQRAVERHGEGALRANFPYVASSEELCALRDARVLAAMAKRVFAAGFRWRVIEAKWDGFELARSTGDVYAGGT